MFEQKKKSKWRTETKVAVGCGILLPICFVGSVLLAPPVIRMAIEQRFYFRRDFTRAERAEFHRMRYDAIEIPEEWQQVNPFPPEVIEARDRLLEVWEPDDNDPQRRLGWYAPPKLDLLERLDLFLEGRSPSEQWAKYMMPGMGPGIMPGMGMPGLGPAGINIARFNPDDPKSMEEWLRLQQVMEQQHKIWMKESVDWKKAEKEYPELLDVIRTLVEDENLSSDDWERLGVIPDAHEIFQKMQMGKEISREELDRIRRFSKSHEPLTQALIALVNTPGYEMDVLEHNGSPPNSLLIDECANLLCLEAHILAQEGRWAEATEKIEVVFAMGRRHPATRLITHLIAFVVLRHGSDCVEQLIDKCDNPQSLSNLLGRMNDLDSQIQLDVLHEAALLSVLGELRSIQRRGHPVDLSSEKPFIYYYLLQDRFAPSGQRWLSLYPDAFPPGDPSDPRFQISYWLGIPQLECAAYIWGMGRPNRVQAEIRERVARAKFDLARILIAQRILELQGKRKASSVVELVPDLLSEEPLDPFVEQPYRYAEERHCLYSAGPDREDNRAMLFYDPTNGTLSTGDIVLGD